MIGLPTSLEVNGTDYAIRSDYRDILTLISAFNDNSFSPDPELNRQCQAAICMQILYKDYKSIPSDDIQEAYKQACWFIDCANRYSDEQEEHIKTMDWDKDEQILFPAINRVAGKEVRLVEYMHWWTFIGLYMEIGECLFSSIIQIRKKLAEGKKLEKYEQEFYRKNKKMIDLEVSHTPEEEKEIAELNAVLDQLT